MKILSLEILNNKLIRVFRMALNGKNLEIAGDTGTGKTTAVSALWDILEKRSDTITKGEKNSTVTVKLGDSKQTIIASRRQTEKTSTIKITRGDGTPVSIADFKKMISALAVNPHEIINLKPSELVQTLLKAADLDGIDISAMDAEISELEEKRLELSRSIKALNPGEEPEKVESVDMGKLMEELQEAQEVNKKINKLQGDLDYEERGLKDGYAERAKLQKELDELNNAISDTEEARDKIKSQLEAISPIPEEPIKEKLSGLQDINKKALAYDNWLTKQKEHDATVAAHKEIDNTISSLRNKKKDALDSAKFPLPGLAITDGQVTYKDCLLENLGESEQILVCAALAIKDILAHPVHVVRLDGIESMSEKDFKTLQELFNGYDIQVLSTRVSRGDVSENEIVIVNGVYAERAEEEFAKSEPENKPAEKKQEQSPAKHSRDEIPI